MISEELRQLVEGLNKMILTIPGETQNVQGEFISASMSIRAHRFNWSVTIVTTLNNRIAYELEGWTICLIPFETGEMPITHFDRHGAAHFFGVFRGQYDVQVEALHTTGVSKGARKG